MADFQPPIADDPELFDFDDHADSHEKLMGLFYKPSPLPDHYKEVDKQRAGFEEAQEREPYEPVEPDGEVHEYQPLPEAGEGAPKDPQVEAPTHTLPDHDIPNPDFGDPEDPEHHTIEPPERTQTQEVEIAEAAQYGNFGDYETPETPRHEQDQGDQVVEGHQYAPLPDLENEAQPQNPTVEQMHGEAESLPEISIPQSENVFSSPAMIYPQAIYEAPWM